MDLVWSLYNQYEKLRIDDLKTEQVRTILLAIPTVRMKDWYACRQGDVHWRPIAEVAEFYEEARVLKGAAVVGLDHPAPTAKKAEKKKQRRAGLPSLKMVAPRRPLFEDPPADDLVTGTALTIDKKDIKERRSARRYHRVLEFIVNIDGKSFNCQTTDISMRGLSLSSTLPTWIPKTFRASLQMKQASTRVLCSKVSDNKIKILEADSWEIVRHWLMNW